MYTYLFLYNFSSHDLHGLRLFPHTHSQAICCSASLLPLAPLPEIYVLEGYRFKILNLSSVNSKIISSNDLHVSLLLSPIRLPRLFLPGLLSTPAAGTCKNEMGYISVTLNEALVVARLLKRLQEVRWPSAPQRMLQGSSPHPPQHSQGRPGYKTCLNRGILRHWLHTNCCWVYSFLQYTLCCYVGVIKES